IDPTLVFSTFLGGSGDDQGWGIAVDASGNIYLTGSTSSMNFPTANPLQGASGGGYDAFVAKLSASGSSLLFSTYLGGSTDDSGNDIAVDGSGNTYVTGHAQSTNFPTQSALQPTSGGGLADAYVAKLNASGSSLLFSTFLGGSSDDIGENI